MSDVDDIENTQKILIYKQQKSKDMKLNNLLVTRILGLLSISLFLCSPQVSCQTPVQCPADCGLMWTFVQAEDALNANLTRIDLALDNSSLVLSRTGLSGSEAERILSELDLIDHAIIQSATVGVDGVILDLAPGQYRNLIGSNISDQEPVKTLLASRQPTGFVVVMTGRGAYALEDAVPVFDENGKFKGASLIILNSADFFSRVLEPFQPKEKAEFSVLQAKNSIMLYFIDPRMTGLRLTDPIFRGYPDVGILAALLMQHGTGYTTYTYLNRAQTKTVDTGAFWTTLGNRGDEIRFALSIELD